ncbi:MAG: hypothetical protein WC683_03270 [bacterium]
MSAHKLKLISWILFSLACLLFIFLNCVFYVNVGALWRDEVSSLTVADMPTFFSTLANFEIAGAPSLFTAILHFWIKIGTAASDAWLRLFPLLISLGIAAALVWRGIKFGRRPPLLALALLAFNPTVFYWGASLRSYGLAVIFIVVLFSLLQKMLEEPSFKNAAFAAVAAILVVQSSFQGVHLVAALCAATAVAGIAAGKKLCALFALAAGAIAGLSLIPYALALLKDGDWIATIEAQLMEISFWKVVHNSFGSAGSAMTHLWTLLITGVLIAPVLYMLSGQDAEKRRERFATSLYAAGAILLSALGQILFIWFVKIGPSPWRTIPLIALFAMAVEAASGALGESRRAWVGRMAAACLIISICLPTIWSRAHVRLTNIDIIAANIMHNERPGDFVVVVPYFCGISFDRYYAGKTPWMTLPPIPQGELAEYDKVIRRHMESPQKAIDPLIEKMTKTLRSGGRVWMVGGLPWIPEKDEQAPELIPAPHPVYGWSIEGYLPDWHKNVGDLLRKHADQIMQVIIPQKQKVMLHENIPLALIEGWKP